MATLQFPRSEIVKPTTVSGMGVPGALRLRSSSGVTKFRSTTATGRSWSETYDMLKAGDPTVENFISFLRRVYNQGLFFQIEHLMTPGSGKDPNGTGTAGVTVSGAGQTGDSILTTGWPASTSDVVKAGDLIRIAGVGPTHEIYEDASSDGSGNATLKINPPIFSGNEPADGASVTTTGVKLNAYLVRSPNIPDIRNSFYYSGIELIFAEAPNG